MPRLHTPLLLLAMLVWAACPGELSGGVALDPGAALAPDAGPTPPGSADGGLPPTPGADGGSLAPDAGAPPASGIWRPKPGTSWHWQLTGTVDTNVEAQMFDIDLFGASAATIAALKAKGRVVICYFSAGSYESWRPDAEDFPESVLGDQLDGWNEQWLDIRTQAVRDIMAKRLDLAKSKGCDGVEPDNVDAYVNSSGFSLGAADQLSYNIFLATEAHKRGLSVGLKNDIDQAQQLEPHFDWAINEECLQYDECDALNAFIKAGKAVFHVEYTPATKNSVCPVASGLGFDSQIKQLDLDAWFDACWS
jgi:hypothetical protein